MIGGDAGRSTWRVPAGLMVLSAVPVAAGVHRLMEVAAGAAARPDNARFVAMPLPISLHIVCAVFFSVFGALQFAGGLRLRYPGLHRVLGRALTLCGMAVALSGLWMTQFYPPIRFDGPVLYVVRLLAGTAMAACLCLGVAAIRKCEVGRHRAWMMRAYALGLGAGTQVFTHIPWFLFPGIQGELARTLCMFAGWGINLAVAEWLIRAGRPAKRHG